MGEKETAAEGRLGHELTHTAQQGAGQPAAITNAPETTWESSDGGLTEGGIQHEDSWEGQRRAAGDVNADSAPETAINNSHSNIKNLRESGGAAAETGPAAPSQPSAR